MRGGKWPGHRRNEKQEKFMAQLQRTNRVQRSSAKPNDDVEQDQRSSEEQR
jgi:hypothetical protein